MHLKPLCRVYDFGIPCASGTQSYLGSHKYIMFIICQIPIYLYIKIHEQIQSYGCLEVQNYFIIRDMSKKIPLFRFISSNFENPTVTVKVISSSQDKYMFNMIRYM